VTRDHKFVAPNFAAGDVRGPCPGLNSLANHGFLPHDGVASLTEYISAANEVYGFGLTAVGFFAAFGTVITGNPVSLTPGFSLGGESPASQNVLGNLVGLLGTPMGLNGSHNSLETDASMTRGDLYSNGENIALEMGLFTQLYDLGKDNAAGFTIDIVGQAGNRRVEQSIAENPFFYSGPATGLIFRNGAWALITRLMANYSDEHPDGLLTGDNLKSFFAISGDEGSFVYSEGSERIPENWYRRPTDYDTVDILADILTWSQKYPNVVSIGGNTGTVNSFTPIDIANLTGGVYNADTLLQGSNLLCFAFQAVRMLTPDFLSTLYPLVGVPLAIITSALNAPIASLDGCPEIKDLLFKGEPAWKRLQSFYPGAGKSHASF